MVFGMLAKDWPGAGGDVITLDAASRIWSLEWCVIQDDPLPEKIALLSGATNTYKIVEVEIVYHSKPAYRNTHSINNKKWVAKSLIQQPNCPLDPALGPGTLVEEVVLPSNQVRVAEALVDASSAHVVPSGIGLVLCSSAAKLAMDAAGLKGSSSGLEGNVDQVSQDCQVPCGTGAEWPCVNFRSDKFPRLGGVKSCGGSGKLPESFLTTSFQCLSKWFRSDFFSMKPEWLMSGVTNFLGRSGHARISGVTNFRSAAFGPEWQGASLWREWHTSGVLLLTTSFRSA
ncbi:hypothetical protein Nepgr_023923 [Nepenthes gracilis]|uniref:Uncharacterized protein n=1 Tax=Nepenthes gracilis TaxID=150966 RepID=A0AAD3XZJ6_NEPGR|nr:hypothetical protein Nepgr_023923 [Nepenthes gracilis]